MQNDNTSRTCKACGEAKPLDAYELLYTGGYRGTCKVCHAAAGVARKRAKREAYESSPEGQAARLAAAETKLARQIEREAKQEATKVAAAEAKAARQIEREAKRLEAAEAEREAREERAAALRDDIWSAMWRGRSSRALEAVKVRRQGMHRIRLRGRGGYITIAELACRVAERDACSRAAKSCKTPEAAEAAMRILERATPAVDRMHEVKSVGLTAVPSRSLAALMGTEEDEGEDSESDLMADAFGDWAPAWMQNTHHASLAA